MGCDRELRLQLSRLSGQYRSAIFRDLQRWKQTNACLERMSVTEIMFWKSNIQMKRRIEFEAKKANLIHAWTEGIHGGSNANDRNDKIFRRNEDGSVQRGR